MKKNNKINKLALSGMFLAISYVLPFVTGQVPEIGNMLCPMHIPVLICGYVCGAPWGLVIGFIAPLLRSFTLGVPTLFPKAVAMAFELATYGFFTGILYRSLPKKKKYIYITLIVSMVMGRLVWGLVQLACLGFNLNEFTFSAFWTASVVKAIPGIILQIILVPIIVMLLNKSKIVKNK